ncbi:hypothetical protein CHRY9390_00963 [Chryseobacterium aquaeductus]|uniref:Uncharacterized protein n=1 Tax=Chryseobacterium aquaeductus TaxID=2675056 RepID=A0A9N8MEF9_9FLAO|nr:hypothetical protein [Chryseobacterium aquaeductus]CAA7330301.1 hypothetical protein CHRY9390_00963 [Chryseobacterium potabilaquae]CAD7802679.1 hypothetical protein CHRY9390_00963 [Chryseobacterium aquaeductus]
MRRKNEDHEYAENSDPNTIPTEVIQSMVDNYRSNQLACINETLQIDDAHSIWFDMVTLKKFISDIEIEAHQVDPHVSEEDLGIRLYYAAYPETTEEPVPEDYARRHTLIMVPTKKQDDLNYDFNPFESDCETDTETALALAAGIGREALAQNHGILVPPGNGTVESY